MQHFDAAFSVCCHNYAERGRLYALIHCRKYTPYGV
jgi:hypothetical protein